MSGSQSASAQTKRELHGMTLAPACAARNGVLSSENGLVAHATDRSTPEHDTLDTGTAFAQMSSGGPDVPRSADGSATAYPACCNADSAAWYPGVQGTPFMRAYAVGRYPTSTTAMRVTRGAPYGFAVRKLARCRAPGTTGRCGINRAWYFDRRGDPERASDRARLQKLSAAVRNSSGRTGILPATRRRAPNG